MKSFKTMSLGTGVDFDGASLVGLGGSWLQAARIEATSSMTTGARVLIAAGDPTTARNSWRPHPPRTRSTALHRGLASDLDRHPRLQRGGDPARRRRRPARAAQ